MKPRAVLWDVDGTLVDSEEFHWLAWKAAMAAEGIEITHEQFLATFGQRNDSIVPRWLGAAATPARVERLGNDKEARYRDLVRRSGIVPLPGAAEWVARLRKDGWLQAIASSAPRPNIDCVLAVTGLAFDAEVSAEDVTLGKPDPQVFLTAASRLEVEPARCIVVEDAPAGIEAARRAGMRSIGVRKGPPLPADIAISSLADLAPDTFARLVG